MLDLHPRRASRLTKLPTALLAGFSLSVAVLAPATAATAQEAIAPLTLEQASGRASAPSFNASAERIRWAENGTHLARRIDGETVWVHPITGEQQEPVALGRPEASATGPDEGGLIMLLQRIDGLNAEDAGRIARSRGQMRSSDGTAIAIPMRNRIYYISGEPDEEQVQAFTSESGARLELVRLSEQGHLSWVEGNSMHIATKNGERHVFRPAVEDSFVGKLDWVYQEEIYGRGNFQGHWWSPDGASLAWLELDESEVMEFTVVDHIEGDHFRVKPEITNYPKVGDPNPTVKIFIGHAGQADFGARQLDLSEYGDEEILVTRVMWTPDSKKMLFVVADRIQSWANLHWVDMESGEQGIWIREKQDAAWTPRPSPPRWLSDGSFLWTSHRTGYQHLYHYSADGELIRTVTEGEWNLNSIVSIDEEAGEFLFTSTEHGAIDTNTYRGQLDGSGHTRLTQGRGSHRVSFNGDGSLFLDTVSALDQLPEVRLCDGRTGEILEVLSRAELDESVAAGMAKWEVHEVNNRDGVPLDVALLKPANFDPNKSYAVWISTYSGPNAPSVRNRWNGSAWFQFLAQNDVLVLQCNVRSASGKGLKWTAEAYKQLGMPELHDLEDAVAWLCANPWADANRVGITGYSYGGFMSAWAMLASDKFKLAVAGGGVYDWRMYDTVYTERYMQTPAMNKAGYDQTSCIQRADQLNPNGFLHMHHGVMDDNVHLQNMMQLAFALQKSGATNWSMMAYPQTRHGIGNRELRWHARQEEWALIEEYLLNR